jgi:hypothetical protein
MTELQWGAAFLVAALSTARLVGLGVLLWGYLTDFNQVWWWVNGWLAVAYVAAIVVSYDGDD